MMRGSNWSVHVWPDHDLFERADAGSFPVVDRNDLLYVNVLGTQEI